ncbi:hypothetical protein C6P46_002187 [Rhodotorula mucilaginosa]|uniref:Uncharacterized protein n=1 Tax=Rhodotorula mucilaginosa TaxID=5537 RepID=A0A9P7B1W1_RHOMI|nr:hypothetical protein C6P46_002187 [Rhodotorula mucilaginosa]
MALTTAELVSGLFGFWSMGLAVWLFVPEFVDVWRHPMPEIDLPRFIFFAAWLVGDAAMLAGLLIVRKYIITQMVLYAIIMVLEVAILLLMMWTDGDLCCAARSKRPSDNALAHLIMGIHGRPHMPPGDKSLEQRRAVRAHERGEMTPEQRSRFRVKVQLGGTVIVLALFTVVWLVVDYREKEDKAPPPVSSLPDSAKSDYAAKMTAYILAWIGLPCWTLPRVYCLVDAYRKRAREGITVASILIGGLVHVLNIASVMLINPSGEPLLAQMPYLLTSIACVVLDGVRLGLTYVLRNAKQLPPAYDYSNMWPYERYLPDYDPTKYADLKRGIHSQSIVSRRKHTAAPSSEDENDSSAPPWEKVDNKHRRADNHHAHALKNNVLGLNARYDSYPDVHPEVARPEHSREERLALEGRNQDRHHVKSANRNWAIFRQKQVKLRELQRRLDTVQEEIALWELRWKAGWPLYERPECERELKKRQRSQKRLEVEMKDLVYGSDEPPQSRTHALAPIAEEGKGGVGTASLPLTPHWQEELESEYESYHNYALHHDYSVEARPLYRLECQFYGKGSILEDLQRELEATKKESGRLQKVEHALVRMGQPHGPTGKVDLGKLEPELREVKQKLRDLQEKETGLATQVDHLEEVREALDRRRVKTATASDWSKDAAQSLTRIGSSRSSSSSPPPDSPQDSHSSDEHTPLTRQRQKVGEQ